MSSGVVLRGYKLLCHYSLHYPESNNIHNKTVTSSSLQPGDQMSNGESSWKPVMDKHHGQSWLLHATETGVKYWQYDN